MYDNKAVKMISCKLKQYIADIYRLENNEKRPE